MRVALSSSALLCAASTKSFDGWRTPTEFRELQQASTGQIGNGRACFHSLQLLPGLMSGTDIRRREGWIASAFSIAGRQLLSTYGDRPTNRRAMTMSTFTITKFTFLSIIGAIYLAAGLSLLFYIDVARIGRRGWPVPVIRMRWDRHGLVDVIIGSTYGVGDQLVRLDMLSH
jgi:hypothetical protein